MVIVASFFILSRLRRVYYHVYSVRVEIYVRRRNFGVFGAKPCPNNHQNGPDGEACSSLSRYYTTLHPSNAAVLLSPVSICCSRCC
jgi:hypothetical protein